MAYLKAAQSARGDYGGGMRGDPGLFGFLGGIAKGALGIAGSILPGPIGAIAKLGSRFLTKRAPQQLFPGGVPMLGQGPARPRGGFKAFIQRAVPGGETGYLPRRRRMNPGNVKALRRAMRRQESFVKLARRALKGSKYAITTRGSSRAPRHITVRESGPGSVTVGR